MNTTPVGAAEGCDLLIFNSPREPMLSTSPATSWAYQDSFFASWDIKLNNIK
jgi:hypothetical protein